MAQEPARLTVGSSFIQKWLLYVQRPILVPCAGHALPVWAETQGARDNRERPVTRMCCRCAGPRRPPLLLRHQLDATILRASFGGVVSRHEIGLAVAVRMQPAFTDSVLDQVIDDTASAPIRNPN